VDFGGGVCDPVCLAGDRWGLVLNP
jgi:hypothetical protein